ncbi:hypothetical protein SAMN05428975_5552 [Mucilaginibacter sp. OK268]|nr:hypothetical protein SAMN05428975_5552 [Mucilaginibacter sp. OK268]
MRALIKYISLLLFSGLIVPFYYHLNIQKAVPLHSKQISATSILSKNHTPGFVFINNVVKNIFPVLKF